MTSTTPTYALPYPDPADPIADGDDTIKALAQRVELVLSSGEVAPGFMGAAVNLAAGATGNMGSITIPQTYRRKTLFVVALYTPNAATANTLYLVPDYADDPRLSDHGWTQRQVTLPNALQGVLHYQIPVGIGAAATTTFQVTAGAAVAMNNVRLFAWVA